MILFVVPLWPLNCCLSFSLDISFSFRSFYLQPSPSINDTISLSLSLPPTPESIPPSLLRSLSFDLVLTLLPRYSELEARLGKNIKRSVSRKHHANGITNKRIVTILWSAASARVLWSRDLVWFPPFRLLVCV